LPKEFTSKKGGIGHHTDLIKGIMDSGVGVNQCLSHARVASFNADMVQLKGNSANIMATTSIELPVVVSTEKIRREFFPKRGHYTGFSIDLLVQRASNDDHKKRKACNMADFFDEEDDWSDY
jgi:hypothetical protein